MVRRAGARAVCSARPEDTAACRAAGAEVVFDYRDPDLATRLRRAAPGGVDLFWDTSGHHDFGLVAGVAAPGARVLLSAMSGNRVPDLPVKDVYTHDLSFIGFVISRATVAQLAAAADLIDDMLIRGELSSKVSEVLPLSATADVHRRLEQGCVSGRILLQPSRLR